MSFTKPRTRGVTRQSSTEYNRKGGAEIERLEIFLETRHLQNQMYHLKMGGHMAGTMLSHLSLIFFLFSTSYLLTITNGVICHSGRYG